MTKGKAARGSRKRNAGDDVRGNRDQGQIAYRLWEIACMLRGIGELIKFRGGEPGLNEEDVNFGIGQIITDIAEELNELEKGLGENLR